MIRITVPGLPVPQGSKNSYCDRTARHRVNTVDINRKELHAWRDLVAMLARPFFPAPYAGPVALEMRFWLKAPQTMPKDRVAMTTKPDLDKLIRAILDALTTAGAYCDDAQVVEILSRKRYAPSVGREGVVIDFFSLQAAFEEAS